MAVTEEQVLTSLKSVEDPDLHADIVKLGFVKDVEIDGTKVSFKVELTTPACPVKDILEEQAREAVLSLDGVEEVSLEMTSRVRDREAEKDNLLPGVRQILVVASGKGGVGKSTVTVNLAIALAKRGAKVGILDADIYGPSIPQMMGVQGERPPATPEGKILPIERYGVKMMSIGFLLEEGQAVLWRGPMVHTTLKQLLGDVMWGDLDYLLIDLPPGTGDAPMSIGQMVNVSGVVIVTTPHSVAAGIAGKAATLFRQLKVTVIGVIENMGDFTCPQCGEATRIFAGTTGEELAMSLEVPYLGSIPLDPVVGESADRGEPSIIAAPERPQADAFAKVAGAVASQLSILAEAKGRERDVAEFEPSKS